MQLVGCGDLDAPMPHRWHIIFFDSLIFFPLALSSVVPAKELILLMVWQVILKTVYEIIALPITIRVVKALKKYEGEDVYDEGISYGWFKF